jgi:hypothetical protein
MEYVLVILAVVPVMAVVVTCVFVVVQGTFVSTANVPITLVQVLTMEGVAMFVSISSVLATHVPCAELFRVNVRARPAVYFLVIALAQ